MPRNAWVRAITATALMMLLAAACSDDKKTTASSSSSTSSSSSSSSSASSSASAGGIDVAAVKALAGNYTGTWTNTTFGSTGAAKGTVTVDTDKKTFKLVFDLDGSVFGASNPTAETLEGTFDETGVKVSATSALFGPFEASLDPKGNFTMTANSVPGGRVSTFSASGVLKREGFTIKYEVKLVNGSTAQGTVTMAPG